MITTLEQATPEWLTAVLREAGALVAGSVREVHHTSNPAFNSTIAHLELAFSADAVAGAPRNLLLKLNASHAGASEARFYRLTAAQPDPPAMLVPCYGAGYDPDGGASWILLADVSDTHFTPIPRDRAIALDGVPSAAQLDQIVDAIAGLHASWWEHPALGSVPDTTEVRWWYRDREHFERHVERRAGEWARFIADVGTWFPSELRAIYELALGGMPRLWERYLARRVASFDRITLTNGDCYLPQFLCPNDPAGTAYIVDFQDASANYGAYDLVYMFATFWTPEQRAEGRRELAALRRYHAGLLANGVRDYGWDDLLSDYRLMLVFMLFDPVWNQTSGAAQAYWWPKLRCLTSAFRDWGCADLLNE